MNRRGSVLLEGVASFSVTVFTVFLLIELLRLGEMHIVMEQAAFIYVRNRAFGEPRKMAKKKSQVFIDGFSGLPSRSLVEFDEWKDNEGWIGRVHVRFPQLIRFKLGSEFKHHLEVTKTCRFPG